MNVIARTSLFTGLAVLSLIVAVADADPWKIDANTNVSTALDSYSDNWVGGEAGTFTWATQFLGAAERQLSPKFNTKTTLNLQFGQTVVQDKTTKDWSVPQKSTDLIDGLELLRLTLGGWADPFLSVRAISEFLDGSDKLLVRYINPFDITEAVGASRTLAKNGDVTWSSRLGGAVHQIVDRHHLDTATGVRSTDVTNDGGVLFNMDLKAANRQKWVTLLSSLQVYEALASSDAAKLKGTSEANDWRQPHLIWENTLMLTFAKYLMLNVAADAYYDRKIASNVRLKETISAGVTYIYSRK